MPEEESSLFGMCCLYLYFIELIPPLGSLAHHIIWDNLLPILSVASIINLLKVSGELYYNFSGDRMTTFLKAKRRQEILDRINDSNVIFFCI